MRTLPITTIIAVAAFFATGSTRAFGQASELDELKAKMKAMEQMMQQMQQKISELERQKAAPAAPVTGTTGDVAVVTFPPVTREIVGRPAEVTPRDALNNQQEGAQRANDLTLDPKYRGYIPVPNTPVLLKFNAKPRLDMTMDNRNSGNPDRFVPAQIPISGTPDHGGDHQFNMNARGSQLSLDVRAPEMAGNFRFYYNNDFYGGGTGGGMGYRIKQLYGQFYNITVGHTFSVFEDPDVWPDTVDYEGPNSALFARQPTVRYLLPIDDHWQINFGLQQPAADIDDGPAGGPFDGASANNQAPDGGFNVRWEHKDVGHVQLANIVRYLGARNAGIAGDDNALGWGVNLSGNFKVWNRDSVQAQVTYGEGIFHFANDNFSNNDAAFDSDGDLRALPYLGLMAGYTHHWSDQFRSTASFGYIDVDNEASQGPDAYHRTWYTSMNVVWQLRKKLSIGLEGLYGKKEVQSGDTGDVFRIHVGLVYSLFD